MLLLWIWIAVVVVALVVLAVIAGRLLGRLGNLRRAAVKLRRRQAEVVKLRAKAEVLEETVLQVRRRTDELQRKIAAISPGSGRR